ncbi:unnamed protein product [Eretmochelys imbricata]
MRSRGARYITLLCIYLLGEMDTVFGGCSVLLFNVHHSDPGLSLSLSVSHHTDRSFPPSSSVCPGDGPCRAGPLGSGLRRSEAGGECGAREGLEDEEAVGRGAGSWQVAKRGWESLEAGREGPAGST